MCYLKTTTGVDPDVHGKDKSAPCDAYLHNVPLFSRSGEKVSSNYPWRLMLVRAQKYESCQRFMNMNLSNLSKLVNKKLSTEEKHSLTSLPLVGFLNQNLIFLQSIFHRGIPNKPL